MERAVARGTGRCRARSRRRSSRSAASATIVSNTAPVANTSSGERKRTRSSTGASAASGHRHAKGTAAATSARAVNSSARSTPEAIASSVQVPAAAPPFLHGYRHDEHGAGEHHQRKRRRRAAVTRPQRRQRHRIDLRVEQRTPVRIGHEKPIELRRFPGALVSTTHRHRNEAGGQRDGARRDGAAALGDAKHALDGNRARTRRWVGA